MNNYEIVTMFTESEIKFLQEMYDKMHGEFHEKYMNLYSVTLKVIRDDSIPADCESGWRKIEAKLDTTANDLSYRHYFLRYGEGSKVSMHDDASPTTIITMVDKDPMLDGGRNIVIDQNTGECLEFGFDVSETVIYHNHTYHGMSYIDHGHRLVLISWYGQPRDDSNFK